MSDARLRELERRAQATGATDDRVAVMREQVRQGLLVESQVYTAAYLSDPTAEAYLSDGLYDMTGTLNDHITGICPCGGCRWDEGPGRWVHHLLEWGQNLPFPGIDDHHAEQEMLIRMGRALAASVFDKLYDPENAAFGAYVLADLRADCFLEQRSEEARARCAMLWNDEEWGAPDWAHQVLYYIVAPSGWRQNMHHWFVESGHLMADPCEHCGNRVTEDQIRELGIPEALAELEINCEHCQGSRWKDARLAREAVERALLPWVLSRPLR